MRRVAVDFDQRGHFLPVVRPVIAHRRRAVRDGDRLRAVLPALGADVFGRIGRAKDQEVLPFKFQRVTEIMGVQNASFEAFKARIIRHVRVEKWPLATTT